MLPYLEMLLEKSFEVIPGEFYNQYRQEVEERVAQSYLFYEVPLLEEKPWQFIRDREYPLFARYLKAKGLDPHSAHGVVVAIFHTDRCYLLRGEDFVKTYREMEGLDAAAFLENVRQWLAT
jgi:hypothetical protein